MILWRVDRLVTALRSDQLTERQKASYVLVSLVLQALIGRGAITLSSAWVTPFALAALVLSLAISVAGVVLAFKANEGGDGRAFIERYVCLAIPLLIRMYLCYVVLWYLLMILSPAARAAAGASGAWNPVAAVLQLVLLIWYLWALRRYLGQVAGNSDFAAAA